MGGYNGSGYVQAESPDVFKLLLQACGLQDHNRNPVNRICREYQLGKLSALAF